MKITDLKIDGFGVWHDLTLRGMSPELTVFYGPNEAGKSTLMQFMRSVLYGVSPSRRERYLPPVDGGRPGGWLKVQTDHGPLTISRYADRGPNDVGKVTIITADGEEQGDRLLREALEHVDEPTYLNIFAVGLREVQELGSLSDTAAAQWLYRLTSGLDRISLYDVIHMLEGTRLRLLNSWEEKSEIRSLRLAAEQLHGELDELVAKGRRWAQSAVKLRELAEEVDRAAGRGQSRSRPVPAGSKSPSASSRCGSNAVRSTTSSNASTICGRSKKARSKSLDDFNKRIEEHERQRDILKGQRHQLRDEAKRLGINDALVRNGQRLEALLEQQEWLQAVERLASRTGRRSEALGSPAGERERAAQPRVDRRRQDPAADHDDIVEQLDAAVPGDRSHRATGRRGQARARNASHGRARVPLADRIGDDQRRKVRPAEGRRSGRRPGRAAPPPPAGRAAHRGRPRSSRRAASSRPRTWSKSKSCRWDCLCSWHPVRAAASCGGRLVVPAGDG